MVRYMVYQLHRTFIKNEDERKIFGDYRKTSENRVAVKNKETGVNFSPTPVSLMVTPERAICGKPCIARYFCILLIIIVIYF